MQSRYFYLIYILVLFFIHNNVNAQFQNGNFEDWITDGNYEIPLNWNKHSWDDPESIRKSDISSNGLYSVKISTYDNIGLEYIPVFIGNKIKPAAYEYQISIDYLIDSIAIGGNGLLLIEQISEGDFEEILRKELSNISQDFASEIFTFSLNSLDTLIIYIAAENVETPTGFDGFCSVYFDNIILTAKPTSVAEAIESCSSFYIGNSRIILNQGYETFTNYSIYNLDGKLLSKSIIINNEIPLYHIGLLFATIYNSRGDFQVIKIVNPN